LGEVPHPALPGRAQPAYLRVHDLARSRLAPFRRAQFRLPDRLAKSWKEHDAVVPAIMRGDGAGSSAAAKAHVAIVSEASAVFASGDG
jgi:DNA-binding FadR family transcriptional regulator